MPRISAPKSPRAAAAAALAGLALGALRASASDDMPPEHFRAVEKYQAADFKGSLPMFEVLRASYQARGDDERAAIEAFWVGTAARVVGDLPKAVEADLDAVERAGRAGDKIFEAAARRESFLALRAARREDEAAAQLPELLRLDEETESDEELASDLRTAGDFQISRGEFADALATADRRIRIHDRTGDKSREGDARMARAIALRALRREAESAREDARGRELQEEALARAKARHATPEADRLRETAIMAQSRGDRAGAAAAWRQMLAVSRRAGFTNGAVIALMNLAGLDDGAGDHKKAIAEAREGAELARADGEALNETSLMLDLAVAVTNDGDLEGGLQTLRRARGLAAARRDAGAEVEILKTARMIYGMRGDYPRMVATNDQILAVARRSGRKKALFEAEKSVGAFYENIGDEAQSLEHYERELALARELGDREKIAVGLNEVAIANMNLGEYEAAERAFRESLGIHEWGGGHVNLGETYLFAGRPEEGYAQLKTLSENHIDIGKYWLLKKNWSRARAIYARWLEGSSDERDVLIGLAAHTGLGLAEEGLRDYARAAEQYSSAESVIDGLRDTLSPAHRRFFLSTADWLMPHLEPFEGMVRVSEFLPGGVREALHHAEFTRGRLFAEAAARRSLGALPELPAARAAAEAEALRKVSAVAAEAERDVREGRAQAAQAAAARLREARASRDALVASLRRDFPAYAAVRYPEPLYAEEFALEPGEIVIEYEVTEPYTKGFLVKDGRVQSSWTVKLSRQELGDLVRKYRAYFEGVADSAQLAAYDPSVGRKLYDLLLAPAAAARGAGGKPLIGPGAKVTIVPDEILGILPFESLVVSAPERAQMPSGRHGPAPAGVTYAGDLFDIAYEYSSTAMTVTRRLPARPAPSSGLFALADPVFNPADPRLRGLVSTDAGAAPERLRMMGAAVRAMGLGGARRGLRSQKEAGREDFVFPRLDKTGALAADLRDKIFTTGEARVLAGTEANKDSLSREDLSRYRYLVFATHGLLDDAIPGLSEPALALSQLGPGAGDGFLRMSEIMSLKLNAEVVALTACQTGLGRQLTGEGVMGLGRAFQYAGARSVLVSLWSVAEDSTTTLAERFFFHLKAGKTRRQALRLARADVRRAGYEHPFYWAPFILIGG